MVMPLELLRAKFGDGISGVSDPAIPAKIIDMSYTPMDGSYLLVWFEQHILLIHAEHSMEKANAGLNVSWKIRFFIQSSQIMQQEWSMKQHDVDVTMVANNNAEIFKELKENNRLRDFLVSAFKHISPPLTSSTDKFSNLSITINDSLEYQGDMSTSGRG